MSLFAYVTLEDAKDHLRIPCSDTADDAQIQGLIYSASAAVKNYLRPNSAYRVALDADDEPTEIDSNYFGDLEDFEYGESKAERARPEVKHAVLILIGEWFRYREGDGNNPDPNYLPRPVRALLYPLRDPVVK